MRIRTHAVGGLAVTVAAAVAVAVVAPAAGASNGRADRSGYAVAARTVAQEQVAQDQVAKEQVAKEQQAAKGKPGQSGQDPVLAAAAKRFGLSVSKIEQGLRDIKVYLSTLPRVPELGLLDPGVVAVFAKSLGISVSRAWPVLRYLESAWAQGGKGAPGKTVLPPQAAPFFAKTLHVSVKRAKAALAQLLNLASGPKGHLDPRSPGFAKIARSLGVSPKRLNAALVALKKFLAQLPPEKGKPAPGKPAPGKPAPGKPAPGKPGVPTKPVRVG